MALAGGFHDHEIGAVGQALGPALGQAQFVPAGRQVAGQVEEGHAGHGGAVHAHPGFIRGPCHVQVQATGIGVGLHHGPQDKVGAP